MKRLSFLITLGIFGFTFSGCVNNYVKSMHPIPSKKLFKKQLDYKNKFGSISTQDDTVITENQLKRFYVEGVLRKVGKIDNSNSPRGYWFIFNKKQNVEYIIDYNKEKKDSFHMPFSMINQKW